MYFRDPQRADLVLRRLHHDIIGNTVCRIGPEVGRHLLRRAQARGDVVADVARGDAELKSPRAIDLDEEIGGIDLLLQMGVDHSWNGCDTAAHLLGNAQIFDPVIADRAYIDLCGESEVQNLRRHIGGLEVE